MYLTEKIYLHPIAPYRYDTARVAVPTVGDYSTVLLYPFVFYGNLSQSRDTPTK